MSDRAVVKLLRGSAVAGAVMVVAASVAMIARLGFGFWVHEFDAFMVIYTIFFATFTWLVAPRQPRNALVWIMSLAAFFGGLTELSGVAIAVAFDLGPSMVSGTISPSELPGGSAIAYMLTSWTWVPALLPTLTLGLLLFPDGELPSPRWRSVGLLAIGGMVLAAVGDAWGWRQSNPGVAGNSPIMFVGFGLAGLAAILSVAALISRLRASTGEAKHQIRWVLWGASIFIIVFMGLGPILGDTPYQDVLVPPIMAAEVIFIGSYGIAVAKYRLYEIDVVISRTFVYGSLAVIITGVYVAVVVGLGNLLGGGDQPNTLLAILATTVVAVVFQPLRRRLQKLANRVVFGRSATPYEVLSSFSQSVAAVDPQVFAKIARSLAEGTTARAVVISIAGEGGHHEIAAWPAGSTLVAGGPASDSLVQTAPIVHEGEELGSVELTLGAGQPFSPIDRRLLEQVASGLGLALRNLKLTEDLKSRVDELRDSRRRIVAVQDLTRRRVERDLHDGAQQRLVALKIKLGIGSSMAAEAGSGRLETAFTELRDQADATIDSVREFARGMYPPLLESEGLQVALADRARRASMPVTVQTTGLQRYTREAESAIYFCVLEAMQNAINHSAAASVIVMVEDRGDVLGFEVRDDGMGFDPGSVGNGLVNAADRLEAVGGLLTVDSSPGRGTVVAGQIPVAEMAGVG